MKLSLIKFIFGVATWNFLFSIVLSSAVISIDFGEDIRVALIKNGQRSPMDLVLNEGSARQSANVLAITKDEVFVAIGAQPKALRSPENAYGLLKNLLGKKSDQLSSHFRQVHLSADIVNDPDRPGVIAFKNQYHEVPFTVEELCAYIFDYIKRMVDTAADTNIRDCVITVPPFFDTPAKKAIIDAASLAGLNVLEVMHDISAAAYLYCLNAKLEEKPQVYVFASLGHTASTVARISLSLKQTVNSFGGNMTSPHVEVQSYTSVPDLGGLDVDLTLRQYILDQFFKANPDLERTGLYKNARAMNRLLSECRKAKHQFSFSNDYTMYLENLYEKRDFTIKVTREDMEGLCIPLKERFYNLLASMVTPEVISCVLVGGNSRISFIKSLFSVNNTDHSADPNAQQSSASDTESHLNPKLPHLATNINADEAVALGACLRAAIAAKTFSITTNIQIKEHFPFYVKLAIKDHELNATNTTSFVDSSQVVTLYSPETAIFDSKKVITLKKKTDFTVTVYQVAANATSSINSQFHESAHSPLAHIRVSKIASLLKEHETQLQTVEQIQVREKEWGKDHAAHEPWINDVQVKVTMKLDQNGIIYAESVALYVSYTIFEKEVKQIPTKPTESEPQTFQPTSTNTEPASEPTATSSADTVTTTTDGAKPSEIPTATEVIWKPVKKTKTISVSFEQIDVFPRLSPAQRTKISARMTTFNKNRLTRHSFESHRYDLECLAYQMRHMTTDESSDHYKFIAPETREAIGKDLQRIFDLIDNSDTPTLEQMQGSLAESLSRELSILQGWLRPIDQRRVNAELLPGAVTSFSEKVLQARNTITSQQPNLMTPALNSSQENILKKLQEFETWLPNMQSLQDSLPTYETPILWKKDIDAKIKSIHDLLSDFEKLKIKEWASLAQAEANEKKETAPKEEKKEEPIFKFPREFGGPEEPILQYPEEPVKPDIGEERIPGSQGTEQTKKATPSEDPVYEHTDL